jgi:spore coat-associated protein N
METMAPVHAYRSRRLAGLLALALVSGSLGIGALSLAIFTDSQAVTGNAFATGTVDISTTPATALFNVSNMMPGDTRSQTIQVNNAGSGALRYAISTSVASGPTLAGQLQLDIYASATCTGTPLYTGALSAAAVGSATQGPNTGDRTLAGLANETLCFKATLPLSTGNSFKNTSTDVTFTFDAEQTANNP